jgi:NAD(P)-dependent dehydrogenase (short-subunit alcohol dehydrogenase family)
LITGGASGIGAACVRHFLAQGWDVAVNYRSPEKAAAAAELVALAEALGRRAIAVQGDVASDADCRLMSTAAVVAFGRLDALVCSAATTRIVAHRDLDGLSAEDFLETAAVNVGGPFQMARACAPALEASGDGAIVMVSSYGAIQGTGSSIAYAASKGALNTLTMSLARVLAPKIRVNAACPALVDDGLVKRLDPEAFEKRREQQVARAPLRKIAVPEEVATAVYWLAAEATLMTGNVVWLDCGLHLTGG